MKTEPAPTAPVYGIIIEKDLDVPYGPDERAPGDTVARGSV